jgi:hypothetical protein
MLDLAGDEVVVAAVAVEYADVVATAWFALAVPGAKGLVRFEVRGANGGRDKLSEEVAPCGP